MDRNDERRGLGEGPREDVSLESAGHELDPYLGTEDVRAELLPRSVRSGFAQIAGQAAKVVLFAASGMALARLLTPSDFGVYAMAMSAVALAMSVQDFGFPLATLQREFVAPKHLRGLFYLNLWLSLAMFALTAALAPAVARFYGEPAVTGVTIAMAAGLLALALGWQHRSVLMRQLRFGTTAAIDLTAVAVSVSVGIGSALAGAGYWALVLQFVVVGVVSTAGYWWRVGWRPDRGGIVPADRAGLRPFVRYGWQYSATRLLSHVGHNLDRVLVAFFHGPRTTGLYDNAYRWAHYPVLQVFPPLITVAVSSLSRARETAGGYAAGIHLGLLSVLSVALPGLAFMAREAPLVILVLLGNQWVETIPLFRWLSVAAFAKALMMGTRWIYLSEGRTGDQLRWAAIDTIVFVVAVSVGVTRGAFGVAVAFTAAACLLAGPAIAYCLRGSDVTPEQYLSAIWRPAVASLAAMAALVVLGDAIPRIGESVGSLSLRLVPYGLVYALAWVLLPGGPREARRLGRLLTELLRR